MSDLRIAAQRVLAEYDNDSVGFKLFGALEALRAALAELDGRQQTHSADCWKWHHECAVAKINQLQMKNIVGDAFNKIRNELLQDIMVNEFIKEHGKSTK